MQTQEDLWSHVSKGPDHWIWTGGRSNGYPTGNWGGTTRSIARVIWELAHGPIARDLFVRVTCGDPLCVRPEHLGVFPGKAALGEDELSARAVIRFQHELDKQPGPDGCWLWTGYKLNSGYGRITIGKRSVAAHRYSYEINVGPIPEGLLICHTCDTPSCVRPSHLFPGTSRENILDMHKKGRAGKQRPGRKLKVAELAPRGEMHHRSKLTDAQAAEIRELFASGEVNQLELGERFGVSNSTISLLVRGKRYGAAKPTPESEPSVPQTRLQFMTQGW